MINNIQSIIDSIQISYPEQEAVLMLTESCYQSLNQKYKEAIDKFKVCFIPETLNGNLSCNNEQIYLIPTNKKPLNIVYTED